MSKVLKIVLVFPMIVILYVVFASATEKKVIHNPIAAINGRFLYNNQTSLSGGMTCAMNMNDAKAKMNEFITFESGSYGRELERKFKNSKWGETQEYYTVNLPEKVKDNPVWNILKCSYFEFGTYIGLEEEANMTRVGKYNGPMDQTSFDHLVWFLAKTGVASHGGIFLGYDVHKSKLSETATEIRRTDSGEFWMQNDQGPGGDWRYSLKFEYVLNKNDRSVYLTKTKN